MGRSLDEILDLCLDEMKRGASVEQCLSLYPEHAATLEPLLRVGKDISELPRVEPRKEAINVALLDLGAAIASETRKRSRYGKLFLGSVLVHPSLVRAVGFALVLIVLIWGLGSLSARSVPGDLLYPLKLTRERVRYVLTRSPEGRAELHMVCAELRLGELAEIGEERGTLDESLLRTLLVESMLALDEANAADEQWFRIFAAKLNGFIAGSHGVLGELRECIPPEDQKTVDDAICLCCKRCECLKQMLDEGDGAISRDWWPECR